MKQDVFQNRFRLISEKKNSYDAEDVGPGLMDDVFLRSLDEPDEL